MPKYQTEIFFPFSVEKIHNMVADIEKYPEFLPNCSHLIIKNSQKTAKKRLFLAEMGVKFSVFSEKFDSNVEIDDMFHEINVTLNSGALKNLTNGWKFIEHGDNQCMAHFSIEIEMKNLPLRLALAAAFKIGVKEIEQAFVTRANKLYLSDS
uniref:Coenzyme Q-binding protein COQ10 START domain-containing protein n=1 Tax=OCS116 cluster bacterium TaxID=2030921 RepID=A0A2A4YR91_9PROT